MTLFFSVLKCKKNTLYVKTRLVDVVLQRATVAERVANEPIEYRFAWCAFSCESRKNKRAALPSNKVETTEFFVLMRLSHKDIFILRRKNMSISVKLPDGSVKSFESQVTCLQVAESISSGLAKNAVCAEVNGVLKDLSAVIDCDVDFKVFTLKNEEGLAVLRHSTAHLMAQAISRIWKMQNLRLARRLKTVFITISILKARK